MQKALQRSDFGFHSNGRETVALGLIVAGSLVQHDVIMQGFFAGLLPSAEKYRDVELEFVKRGHCDAWRLARQRLIDTAIGG